MPGILDMLNRVLPQTSGIMKASDALGMANSKADLAAQLAKLKKDGPPNAFSTSSWQAQMDALQSQIDGKPAPKTK
jgi:hypothetical protein